MQILPKCMPSMCFFFQKTENIGKKIFRIAMNNILIALMVTLVNILSEGQKKFRNSKSSWPGAL